MRKLSIVVLLMVFLVGCETESLAPTKSGVASQGSDDDDWDDGWAGANSSNSGAKEFSGIDFKDQSGKVKIKLFYKETDPARTQSDYVQVSDRYVLIGGTSWITGASSTGAFITESRPESSEDFKKVGRSSGYANRWRASSQDHTSVDKHTLHIVAIGLKLSGISSEVLKEYVRVFESTSCTQSQPSTWASVPGCYLLLGGGARVNPSYRLAKAFEEEIARPSNFLVHSYAEGNTWYVRSKDHLEYSPASITAYAIGIQDVEIPGFGRLESTVITASGYVESGISRVSSGTIPRGWLISGLGASTNYGEGSGRMLMGTQIDPLASRSRAISKDYSVDNAGETMVYTTLIRKKSK